MENTLFAYWLNLSHLLSDVMSSAVHLNIFIEFTLIIYMIIHLFITISECSAVFYFLVGEDEFLFDCMMEMPFH